MLGTVVNTLAIITGSIIGIVFKGGLPGHYSQTILQAVGLAVVLIGLAGAMQSKALLMVILSLAFGSLMGEVCRIEARLEQVGQWLQQRFTGSGGGFAEGFVTASLVFCVGAMAIVGALESGLSGNHQTLYAKSMLDGITSIVFASTLGAGVLFSSLSVLVYQGLITLAASSIKTFLTPEVVQQMASVGGLLIMAIGLNMLGVNKIRVGNMLPAIFMPLIYAIAQQWIAPGA